MENENLNEMNENNGIDSKSTAENKPGNVEQSGQETVDMTKMNQPNDTNEKRRPDF